MPGKPITLLCLLMFLSQSLYADKSGFSNSYFTRVDGLKLHYRIWLPQTETVKGNVLMVHGFGGSTFSWQQAGDSLASIGYMAVAVDVPPFGFSDRAVRQNHAVTARAQLLNDFLLQEFPDATWHLAGHSMGGSIVQAMALMYPENFETVNFVAATLFEQIEKGRSPSPLWLYIPGLTAFVGNIAESWFITPARIKGMLASAFGEPPSPYQIKAYLAPLQIPGTARAILQMQKRRNEIVSLHLNELAIPALAIWGGNDTWVPLESRRPVLEKNTRILLSVIDDAGHNPMETHFDAFMAIWLTFLDKRQSIIHR